jgi:hypothetical protein
MPASNSTIAPATDDSLVVDVLHELRSPLTVVDGRVFQLRQQLRAGNADPAQLVAKLDEIAKATHVMAAALEQLAARASFAP